jgi:hypothetical protein
MRYQPTARNHDRENTMEGFFCGGRGKNRETRGRQDGLFKRFCAIVPVCGANGEAAERPILEISVGRRKRGDLMICLIGWTNQSE